MAGSIDAGRLFSVAGFVFASRHSAAVDFAEPRIGAPSSRGAMIVDPSGNFAGEAPPVAPAGRRAARHDMVFGPVPPRRQPRGALARFPFERNRSNDKKSRKIKILEQVLITKVCQLSRDLL